MLINLKLYAICAVVIIALVSGSYMYLSYRIEKAVNERYTAEVEKLKTEQLQNLQHLQHEQNETVTAYLNEINALKQQHEQDLKEIENAKFKDTITVNVPFPVKPVSDCGMHENNNSQTAVPAAGTQSDLICYTRSELQRKIKESLALAEECDALSVRYVTLLKICKGQENEQK